MPDGRIYGSSAGSGVVGLMRFRGSFQPGAALSARVPHPPSPSQPFSLAIITPEAPAVNGCYCIFPVYFTLGRLHLYTVARTRRAKITAMAVMAERKPATPSRSRM